MKTKSRQINIGMMKQRVTIQYYSLSSDGMGGNTRTWNTLGTVWANVMPLSGSEALEVGGLKGNTKYKIRTRYRDDFVSAGYSRDTYDHLLRLLYDGKTMNVEYAINASEDNAITEIIANAE
jgi:SPP1 family predicted phage head-tail adaptor